MSSADAFLNDDCAKWNPQHIIRDQIAPAKCLRKKLLKLINAHVGEVSVGILFHSRQARQSGKTQRVSQPAIIAINLMVNGGKLI